MAWHEPAQAAKEFVFLGELRIESALELGKFGFRWRNRNQRQIKFQSERIDCGNIPGLIGFKPCEGLLRSAVHAVKEQNSLVVRLIRPYCPLADRLGI